MSVWVYGRVWCLSVVYGVWRIVFECMVYAVYGVWCAVYIVWPLISLTCAQERYQQPQPVTRHFESQRGVELKLIKEGGQASADIVEAGVDINIQQLPRVKKCHERADERCTCCDHTQLNLLIPPTLERQKLTKRGSYRRWDGRSASCGWSRTCSMNHTQ
jgi:hypothetical protein